MRKCTLSLSLEAVTQSLRSRRARAGRDTHKQRLSQIYAPHQHAAKDVSRDYRSYTKEARRRQCYRGKDAARVSNACVVNMDEDALCSRSTCTEEATSASIEEGVLTARNVDEVASISMDDGTTNAKGVESSIFQHGRARGCINHKGCGDREQHLSAWTKTADCIFSIVDCVDALGINFQL